MTCFLNCDADGCTHTEQVPGISEDLIGKPCPICGASLLTETDYRQWIVAVAPGIELMKAMGLVNDTPQDAPGQIAASLHLHNGVLSTRVGPASKVFGEDAQ